ELGGGFDGLLVAITLGQCLDEHKTWVRLCFLRDGLQTQRQLARADALDDGVDAMPDTVGQQDLLPDRHPLHRRAMASLGTVQKDQPALRGPDTLTRRNENK